MVSKLATFRTDSDIWDSFQEKAKSKGTNASALLQKFVRDYLDDKLDSRIDRPAAAPDVAIQTMIDEAIAKQSPAPDVDIQTMIDDALSSKIRELREEFEEHEAIMVSRSQKAFEEQIKIFRSEMDEAIAPLLARLEALETNRSEATAPANFTQALFQKAKEVAPMKLKEIA